MPRPTKMEKPRYCTLHAAKTGKAVRSAKTASKAGNYVRSAESRRKMAEAQRKRWAAVKKAKKAQG